MAPTTRLSSESLASYFKVDCFGANQTIRFPGQIIDVPIVTRLDFFNHIYAHPINEKICLKSGLDQNYKYENYEEWIEKITTGLTRSIVVFVEGYAGCGKSVFVQKVLSEIFPDLDYASNYYDYDCGTLVKEGIDKSVYNGTNRIRISILTHFINQYIKLYDTNQAVLEKMEEFLKQSQTQTYLNPDLHFRFLVTNAYKDAKNKLMQGNRDGFRNLIFDQLAPLSAQTIIYLDCIMRLAKYTVDKNEPEALMICYDNLDAIEDILELKDFDDVLVAVKENMNKYLLNTSQNYTSSGKPVPHFVLFATFRKITSVKAGTHNLEREESKEKNEGSSDGREKLETIFYIDASHLFDYAEIITKRYDYLKAHLPSKTDCKKAGTIIEQFGKAVDLFKTEFAKKQFAGFWNNNIRTSSDILEQIVIGYSDDVQDCIDLANGQNDVYDNRINIASGASAILLHMIFDVQKKHNYWDTQHYDVSNLLEEVPEYNQLEANPSMIYKLATLSRLIITYIGNVVIYENRDVSTKDIFKLFMPVYTVDEIARTLANMLKHDFNGIWRRPIIYVSDVEVEQVGDVEANLKYQGQNIELVANWDDDDFTRLTICDCGESYIKKIICDYEYYSVRVGNKKSLFSAKSLDEIETITKGVYSAVAKCCEKMKLFMYFYCDKTHFDSNTYLDLMFHPRTENGKPQLHTERVIFKHIEYLDNFRLFVAKSLDRFNSIEKIKIRELLLDTISAYLDLYDNKIKKIDSRRTKVAGDLVRMLGKVKEDPNDNTTRIRSI